MKKIKFVIVHTVKDEKIDIFVPYVWTVKYQDGTLREYRFANDDSTPIYAHQLPKYIKNYVWNAEVVYNRVAGDQNHMVARYEKIERGVTIDEQ